MPVSDSNIAAELLGHTGSGPVTFTFQVRSKADLQVWVTTGSEDPASTNELAQAEFLFSPSGSPVNGLYNGGSVTLVTPITDRNIFVAARHGPERTSDFSAGPQSGTVLNTSLDQVHVILRDLDDRMRRAVLSPPGEAESLLPDRATNVAKVLQMTADGVNLTPGAFPVTAGLSGQVLMSDGTDVFWGDGTFDALPSSPGARVPLVGADTGSGINGGDFALPDGTGTANEIMRADGAGASAWAPGPPVPATADAGKLVQVLAAAYQATPFKFPTAAGSENQVLALDDNGDLVFTDAAGLSLTEGTWTPTLTFATPGDLSVSYGSQRVGRYIKLGNWVLCTFSLTPTPTFTTASGAPSITGLPFTPSTAQNGWPGWFDIFSGVDVISGLIQPAPRVSNALGATVSFGGIVESGGIYGDQAFNATNFNTGAAHSFRGGVIFEAVAS